MITIYVCGLSTGSDDHFGQFVSARVYETKSQMVSGTPEHSDRVTLAQRLLRYYAGSSTATTSDRDVISEHMGHLCVFLSRKISEHLATGFCVYTVLAPAIPRRQHSRTYAGSLVAVSMSQRNSRQSWTRLCTTARPFQIYPPSRNFRI